MTELKLICFNNNAYLSIVLILKYYAMYKIKFCYFFACVNFTSKMTALNKYEYI